MVWFFEFGQGLSLIPRTPTRKTTWRSELWGEKREREHHSPSNRKDCNLGVHLKDDTIALDHFLRNDKI